ncbi:MAG: type II toxin-antitoxin system VapC family toxin [Bryobacteraceae bacterium]
MPSVVVDTHAAVWYFLDYPRLSQTAGLILDQTTQSRDPILIPSISLVELVYLIEEGRIPASTYTSLRKAIDNPIGPFSLALLDQNVVDAVHSIDRQLVPDLPDHVIAATALVLNLPLVSRDAKIRTSQIQTIW